MATQVAALILAGGRSSRMGGGDKPLALLAGQPILAHILRRLQPEHRLIAISANGDPVRFAAFGLPVLADEVQGVGPLGGILAGLLWAKRQCADLLLTVPGDAPFLPHRLGQRLAPAPAMASSAGRPHPTAALWQATAAAALVAHLQTLDPARRRDFSVAGFAGVIGARTIAFDTAAGDPFLNINTPDDLARAEAMLAC